MTGYPVRVRVALKGLARGAWTRFSGYSMQPCAPPPADARLDRVLYGMAQPVLAFRQLKRDPQLMRAALEPALLLAGFCGLVALVDPDAGRFGFITRFYGTFAVLAPVPPVVLGRHYARLAAAARTRLSFGECAPLYRSMVRLGWEALAQVVLIAVAIAPVTLLLGSLPRVGQVLAAAAVGAWTLHWIVVEALDNARVLPPGWTAAQVDEASAAVASPWFVRGFRRIAKRSPRGLRGLLNGFARVCDRLSRAWREEIALIEQHRWLAAGFSLTTALLLAVPVLNLLFRPIIIVASSHLLGQLERLQRESGA